MRLSRSVSITQYRSLDLLTEELEKILDDPTFFYHATKDLEMIQFKNWKMVLSIIPVLRRIARESDFDIDQSMVITSFLNYCEAVAKEHEIKNV